VKSQHAQKSVCGVLLISSISLTLKYDVLILSFYPALCQSVRNFRPFALTADMGIFFKMFCAIASLHT
jgi:hypothetical protein